MWVERGSLLLAPMAGVTDKVYREICTRFGADGTVTEMVSAKGYLLTPREREEVVQLRETSPGERCALQIFGSDADFMGRAAERLCEDRFFALDVNMGCPAPKIVSGGDGSAMLRDLPNAERVLRAVVRNAALPVTVKMRMGWDESSVNYLDAGKMGAGLRRRGRDAPRAHAQRNVFRPRALGGHRRAERAPFDPRHRQRGRGECAGPRRRCCGRRAATPSWSGAARWAIPGSSGTGSARGRACPRRRPRPASASRRAHAHARALVAHKGEYIGLREMRKHAAWYLKGPARQRAGARAREPRPEPRGACGHPAGLPCGPGAGGSARSPAFPRNEAAPPSGKAEGQRGCGGLIVTRNLQRSTAAGAARWRPCAG